MTDAPEALAGPDHVLVPLDPVQARQVRWLAESWGLTAEQVLQGLICNRLAECAAAAVDLIPSERGMH